LTDVYRALIQIFPEKIPLATYVQRFQKIFRRYNETLIQYFHRLKEKYYFLVIYNMYAPTLEKNINTTLGATINDNYFMQKYLQSCNDRAFNDKAIELTLQGKLKTINELQMLVNTVELQNTHRKIFSSNHNNNTRFQQTSYNYKSNFNATYNVSNKNNRYNFRSRNNNNNTQYNTYNKYSKYNTYN